MIALYLILNYDSFSDHDDVICLMDSCICFFKAAKNLQPKISKLLCSNNEKTIILNKLFAAHGINRTKRELFMSILSSPYEKHFGESDEPVYVNTNILIVATKTLSDAALVSYIYNMPLISYPANGFDQSLINCILLYGEESNSVDIRNISDTTHIDFHSDFLRNRDGYDIPICDIEPQFKKYHFQDHHGKDMLLKYKDKILRSPYVVSLESGEWKRSARKFTGKYYSHNGIWYIYLVLYKTDEGFSYLAQITANDMFEANLIANELEKIYP